METNSDSSTRLKEELSAQRKRAPSNPRIDVEQSPLRCPFCHDGIETQSEPWVACAECLARHHTECWDDAGVCSACGRDRFLELSGSASRAREPRPTSKRGADLVRVARDRADACSTIGEALKQVAERGTVLVSPGTYREVLVLDRPVTLQADGGEVAVISSGADCVRVQADDVVLEGLTIKASAALGSEIGSALRLTTGRTRVTGCDLSSSTLEPCLAIEGRTNRSLVEKCRVHDGRGGGILVASGAAPEIEGCEVWGHKVFGIAVRSASATIKACTVRDSGTGILCDDGGTGSFTDCDVTACRDVGVRVTRSAKPTFHACKIHDSRGEGVRVDELGEGTFDVCRVFRSARAGVLIERNGDPVFVHSKVHDGLTAGVVVRANGRGRFEDSSVVGNAQAGVEVSLGGAPTIVACRVRQNGGTGVWVREGASGRVERCDLTNNDKGAFGIEGRNTLERVENSERR